MERLPRLVDTPAELGAMLAALDDAPLIAVDTESNAFHAYRPRVCLIQIADREREWAVDARLLEDLAPLGELLERPTVLKVLHAADGDILGLKRDFGFGVTPVFDTMLSARILGRRRFGLADLLAEYFGVTLDKRFQRHDWGQRPIPPPALRYAAADVRYLPALHDRLRQQLVEAERMQEAEEEFARLTRVHPEEREFDPEGFWRVRGARELAPVARAVLRELYLFRDNRARALDRPPVRVLGDEALLALSQQRPTDPAGLRRAGLSPLQADRFGAGLLAAIERGMRAAPPEPRRGNGGPPDPRVTARYDALRAWRRARAAARGVEPEIIVSNASLRALARAAPATRDEVARVAELGPWKAREYADDLLAVLKQTP
jgi:ribonuclease D